MTCHRIARLSIVPLLFVPLFAATALQAAVKPHALFSDDAVLQQGMKVPVWGTANDGEKVTVKIQGQEVTTTAKDGKWRVDLAPLKTGGPFELTIAGENTITLKNVLVGEVWIASGQSNMVWSVKECGDAERTIAGSANPQIRLFTVPRQGKPQPQSDVTGAWSECGPTTVTGFSAVAYCFGRDLQQQLKVPVGLISTNVSGTPAESWTSRKALEANPALKSLVVDPASNKPKDTSGLYNAMIHPLIPYAIRGAIWYQGESNAGRAYEYRTLFPAMISDWRAAWGQGDFTFLLVQLAPFMPVGREQSGMRVEHRDGKIQLVPFKQTVLEPSESDWAELREAQLLATQVLPNVAMAVITDVGDERNIHPPRKAPVGARLALAARAVAYGEPVEFSGPVYYQQKIDGNHIVLEFKHSDGGLVAKDGPLTGFTIAGADKKFVHAQAEIKGDTVVVSSPEVKAPVAVRFGWWNYPVVNLWNKADLPASPFRTDDFPLTTAPKK